MGVIKSDSVLTLKDLVELEKELEKPMMAPDSTKYIDPFDSRMSPIPKTSTEDCNLSDKKDKARSSISEKYKHKKYAGAFR